MMLYTLRRPRMKSRKVIFVVSKMMAQISMMHVKCWQHATTDDLMVNARDENDILRVPIVRLTHVLLGAVDCSLAVTNNSPV